VLHERGLVSGITIAIPRLFAVSNAIVALVEKFSSVHVNPESQKRVCKQKTHTDLFFLAQNREMKNHAFIEPLKSERLQKEQKQQMSSQDHHKLC
jgi:hypothetical protein